MTFEMVKAVDFVIKASRNSIPEGIGHFVFQEKFFVVGEHVANGYLVVLGIKDPNHVKVSRETTLIEATFFV